MKGGLFLSDKEWKLIEPSVPKVVRRKDGRGRPPRHPREVLNGIIWILFSGAPWYMLPKGIYPPYQTCHRYFQKWVRQGVLQRLLFQLSKHYARKQKTPMVSFIDGSFSPAKKGGTKSVKP
ncbi:MAG TPA: transposase [Flavisolibacter sp.]|nr:transposase [Flavisolibacter sp.]